MLEIDKKNEINTSDAAPPTLRPEDIELNEISYNCSECSSLIEILLINEDNNIIKFKCLNKIKNHNIKVMPINEYLKKMKKFNNSLVNKDKCEMHTNKRYITYCLDCNCHLCKDCLKTRTHINHNKNNIIAEIQPTKEELNIMKEIIKDYDIKLKNLKIEKIYKTNELEKALNELKKIENKQMEEKLQINKSNREKELKENYNKYISDIEVFKNEYEEKIKIRKNKYESILNKINGKYKLINEKNYITYLYRLNKLEKKYNDKIKNLAYDKKIENMNDVKKLNELVYNTYNAYNNNYYNSINIINILSNYCKKEYYINNILKKLCQNNYEDIIKMILQNNVKKNEDKEKKNMEYESIIMEMKEHYEKNIENIKKEKNKIIKEFEEYKVINERIIKDFNDEILIIYKIEKDEDLVKIFYPDFVELNKNNCKIVYEEKEYDLKEEFDVKNIKKDILEIRLKGIMNITNMHAMFYGCSSLISLPNISKWNTSKITDMSSLFGKCTSLITLPDISKWNTSNVTNMHSLFYGCSSLISLPDISKWVTSNVTDMHSMFSECSSLLELPDISKWKIDKVTSVYKMFKKCLSLKNIPDISKWNISNINNMCGMFFECSSLLSFPDISNWDTANVSDMSDMFSKCSSLNTLPEISKWNSKKENMPNISKEYNPFLKASKFKSI